MNPTPEQIASAINTITDAFKQGQMRGVFIARPACNSVNIVSYPGYHVSPDTDDDIEQIAQQLYQAAMQTPKSHIGSIILNTAAAMCVASPEIGKRFLEDLGKKQAQMQFDKMRQDVFKDSDNDVINQSEKNNDR